MNIHMYFHSSAFSSQSEAEDEEQEQEHEGGVDAEEAGAPRHGPHQA